MASEDIKASSPERKREITKTACGAICPDDLSLICSLDKGHDATNTDYHCSVDGEAWLTMVARITRKKEASR